MKVKILSSFFLNSKILFAQSLSVSFKLPVSTFKIVKNLEKKVENQKKLTGIKVI